MKIGRWRRRSWRTAAEVGDDHRAEGEQRVHLAAGMTCIDLAAATAERQSGHEATEERAAETPPRTALDERPDLERCQQFVRQREGGLPEPGLRARCPQSRLLSFARHGFAAGAPVSAIERCRAPTCSARCLP